MTFNCLYGEYRDCFQYDCNYCMNPDVDDSGVDYGDIYDLPEEHDFCACGDFDCFGECGCSF